MIDMDIRLVRDNFEVKVKTVFGAGITGLFGASGSGKTSLLQTIVGLTRPDAGFVNIDNVRVFDKKIGLSIPVHQRKIGYVFQEGRLFPHMTVEKNLKYGICDDNSHISFNEVVDLLQLGFLLKSKPGAISGGERQRTALGRTLLSSPKWLLLDEPFSALDTTLREQILPFLQLIHDTTHLPMLIVSHDLTDLLKLTHRICVLDKGAIVAHDSYHHLIQQKNVQRVISRSSLINVVKMKVLHPDNGSGLTILSPNGESTAVKVICKRQAESYAVGESVTVFIRPDDIALSRERVEQVTIQNQIKGVIEAISEWDNVVLCHVNVGFKLLVEITPAALLSMGLTKGDNVWTLFKSVAINVAY